jgi:hypothetical protein
MHDMHTLTFLFKYTVRVNTLMMVTIEYVESELVLNYNSN